MCLSWSSALGPKVLLTAAIEAFLVLELRPGAGNQVNGVGALQLDEESQR